MFDSWTKESIVIFGTLASFMSFFALWVFKYYNDFLIFGSAVPLALCLIIAYVLRRE